MNCNNLLGVKPFATSNAKTIALKQHRHWLTLLLVICLSGVLPGQLLAGDGALVDPTSKIGPGPFAGVQVIPEIRGQTAYPNVTDAPFNGYNLIYGTFSGIKVGSYYANHFHIARLMPNGTLDTTFANNQISGEIRGVYIYPHNYPVAALQDKILIWGRFSTYSGSPIYWNLACLNADGSLDTTFPVLSAWDGAVNAVALQGPDGGPLAGTTDKILVGGYNLQAASTNTGPTYQLIRLNYDGTPDSSFTHWGAPGAYINSIRVYLNDPTFGNNVRLWCSYPKNPNKIPNGSNGTYYVLFLDPNVNMPDKLPPIAFIGDETVDGPIFNMARQNTDGKFLITGQFKNAYNAATASWVPRNRIARLNVDGTLDPSYDVGVGPNGVVTQISPMMTNSPYDDRMVVAGNFTTWNGSPCGFITLLQTDGTVDPTFTTGTRGDDRIMRIYWKADGSGGWAYGYFHNYNGQPRGGITGLNADGTPNASFGNVTAMAGWTGMVYSLATQKDGKILIGGDFNGVQGQARGGFARLNPDGTLDSSLKGAVDGTIKSVAVQSDGKILVGGTFGQCQSYTCTSLARLNPDGSFDQTFNPMLVGHYNHLNQVNHVVPLANGQIMIAGKIFLNSTTSFNDYPVVRLNADGSLDADFFNNLFFSSMLQYCWGNRVAVVGDKYLVAGGIELGGYYYASPGFLSRLNHDGTMDTNFFAKNSSVPGLQGLDGVVSDLLLQPDGKIVVSGSFSHVLDGSSSPPAQSAIARFSGVGLLDNTFVPNLTIPSGANAILLSAMAWQPNGKILIEENFFYNDFGNSEYKSTQVARLNSNGSLDPSFSLGTPAGGYFSYWNGNCILTLPHRKALIGGCFNSYNSTPAWGLVQIFVGPQTCSIAGIEELLLTE